MTDADPSSGDDTAMPMFPLGSVLFPGGVLPLHVFEPRYRQLVEDCLTRAVPEFGVVLIERGSEVGGGDLRGMWGTVARMVQVGRLADGRYAVIAVGHRRIRVQRWLDDAPYPRAMVEDWPDDDAPSEEWDELRERVARDVRRTRALAAELGDVAAVDDRPDPADPVGISFDLSDRAPLGALDRQVLLAAPHPVARLTRLAEMVADAEALLRFRLGGG